jgi:hypothetical protein
MKNNDVALQMWFLAFCVEIYKHEKGMTGQEAYNYLANNGATGYITECAGGLHMTGPLYIIDSIDEYIRANREHELIDR